MMSLPACISAVWIYLFLLPFQLVGQFGWYTIPGVGIAAFFYIGFLAAGEEIEQPFGEYSQCSLNTQLNNTTTAGYDDVSLILNNVLQLNSCASQERLGFGSFLSRDRARRHRIFETYALPKCPPAHKTYGHIGQRDRVYRSGREK